MLLFLLIACSGPDTQGPDSARDSNPLVDSGEHSDTNDVGADELNGTIPDVALPAPEFVARNRDDTVRGQTDLLGAPTVLWFYPAAATAG